jgi:hypothetical protein
MSCPPALSSPSGVSDQELQVNRELFPCCALVKIMNDDRFFVYI